MVDEYGFMTVRRNPAAPWRIRPATYEDAMAMQQVEIHAGRIFAEHGMDEIAADDPPSLGELSEYCEAGLAWVALSSAGPPVAYLVARPVDQCLHIEQVSVHPDKGRHGIGGLLLEHVAREAAAGGFRCLTLTTFAEVPWNAPYYTTLGFYVLKEADWTEGLSAIRTREGALGLDRWPRLCMRRDLTLLQPVTR